MEKLHKTLSDNELMQMFAYQDDRVAFERLYHKYKDPLIRFSYGYTFSQAKAEEMVHETFLKVFRFKDRYDPEKPFKTWLWTICKNTNLDALDKTKHYREESFENYMSDEFESVDSALEGLIESAEREKLKLAISKLPLTQREALLLWMNDDLSFEDMGRILNKSAQAIKNLVHRGKLALKIELSK